MGDRKMSGIFVPVTDSDGVVYRAELIEDGAELVLEAENPDVNQTIEMRLPDGRGATLESLAAALVRFQGELMKRWPVGPMIFRSAARDEYQDPKVIGRAWVGE